MHDIATSTGYQMSLFLLFSLSGYLLAAMTRQSAIVGQIIIGVIIGPSVLGLITYKGLIVDLAHLGAVILLFVVGLEFKLKELINIRSFCIALIGVALPWTGGFLCAKLFGYDILSSLFIGTALTATSIAITANVLFELGYLKSNVANTIIGAAVIDDVLALLALTITVQITKGSLDISGIVLMLGKAIIFLGAGISFGYCVIRKLVFKFDETKFAQQYPDFVFVLIMTLAFLYAVSAVLVGLSDIIGAFIAGVVLEGISLKNSRKFHDGADYLRIIFASIFFVSLGVLADINAIDLYTLVFSLVLILIAVTTKVFGCGLVAKCFNLNWRESFLIGICMSPRGEVAMVVALIALQAKMIQQDIYVALILVSLVTTIIAPIGIRKLLKDHTAHVMKPL